MLTMTREGTVDGSPDLATLKVFVSSPSQGVSYNAGIWREFAATNLILEIHWSMLTRFAFAGCPALRPFLRVILPLRLCRHRHPNHDRQFTQDRL